MDTISPTLLKEIEQRLAAGRFTSVDDLLTTALRALDGAEDLARELFELELIHGLEGDDVEMTSSEWDAIEAEALEELEAKKPR